ncbi:MAG TPA: class I SAM-dependent methyltransferase [Prolixibacteraceae bacterium]|nr:class I SAM-dependent methyltransferase [Prolixibacteraceae bacterium]
MKEKNKIGNIYRKDTTEAYNKTFGDEIERSTELDRFFLDLIPGSLEGKVALDLGAGNGRYSELLHQRGAERVISFDLSDAMLEQVNIRKTQKQLARIEIMKGDLEQLPFEEKKIDYILSRFSLMYTNNLSGLIDRLGQILSDNGEVLIQANYATFLNGANPQKEKEPVPLVLKIGDNCVSIKNFPNTLDDYHTAFQKAGFCVANTLHHPALELSVDECYPHAKSIEFRYIVFHLRKKIETSR